MSRFISTSLKLWDNFEYKLWYNFEYNLVCLSGFDELSWIWTYDKEKEYSASMLLLYFVGEDMKFP